MARIEATTHIEADPEKVWATLIEWESQPRWMVDARSVEVTSLRREGVGVVLSCKTGIALGIVVTDTMAVTEWHPPRLVGVQHQGRVIRGVGGFELTATPSGTHFVWWEEATAPFGSLGDSLAQLLVAPYIRRTFRASLANLKAICESTRPTS